MLLGFRLKATEPVQYFQFDQDGNMYMYAPGAGFSGNCTLVRPAVELFTGESSIFETEVSTQSVVPQLSFSDGCSDLSQKTDILLR